MRFDSVNARSFGPFSGKVFEFAPGMNVIYGPNESGKSSLHAAIYAALCGVRRAKGSMKKEDREFADSHRPWSGDAWEVGTALTLQNGRRVELRHDLHGKVGCRATDADFGKDISEEIIYEGSPDGSVWLGLDRRTFLSTACVRQTDLLAILESPELLQDHLQRAAANATTDATAAAAIKALEEFRKENVGADRSNSVKPLARALRDVEDKTKALESANTHHKEFLDLYARSEGAESSELAARRESRMLRAAKASQIAERVEEKFEEARALDARHRDAPRLDPASEDRLAQGVAAALSSWRGRPEPLRLAGPDSRELRSRIEALPTPPPGDMEPHSEVVSARDAYLDAKRRSSLHEEDRPPEPSLPETGGLDEEALRDLARKLESEERGDDARDSERRTFPGLTAGIVAILLGVLTTGFGLLSIGLPLMVVGAVMLLWGVYRFRIDRSRRLEERRNVRGSAREEAASYGVSTEPSTIRRLAVAEGHRRDLERWRERKDTLAKRRDEAGGRLAHELGERGVAGDGSPEDLLERYNEACAERAEVARRASTREDLQERMETREAQERTAAEHERQRAAAEEEIRKAAIECGMEDRDSESLARELKEWQGNRAADLARRRKDADEWARLEFLLDGGTLDELDAEASRLREAAARLSEGLDTLEIADVDPDDVDLLSEDAQRKLECASGEAARLDGQIKEQAVRLPGVPEAEEELFTARGELDRVRHLETTLNRTLEFLRAAEEKVHRNIAPILADTVRGWLPKITANRYADARVNPERLTVAVCGEDGAWRDAARLSLGAREQIYLLLRMSVVEHLTKPGEVCPLILDDITTQCDGERTSAILGMLHEVSRRRQVILLSQESDVLEWAEGNIRPPEDSLVKLDPSEIPV